MMDDVKTPPDHYSYVPEGKQITNPFVSETSMNSYFPILADRHPRTSSFRFSSVHVACVLLSFLRLCVVEHPPAGCRSSSCSSSRSPFHVET